MLLVEISVDDCSGHGYVGLVPRVAALAIPAAEITVLRPLSRHYRVGIPLDFCWHSHKESSTSSCVGHLFGGRLVFANSFTQLLDDPRP